MILFILSEIMFFFGFFWSFFHSALVPSIFIGAIWPPVGIQINSLGLPLIGTVFLLISGYYYTYSYKEIILKNIEELVQSLIITISFGTAFLFIQFYEYYILPFGFSNNIYTCCFFLLTGFHGFHVLIGVIFIFVFFIGFIF
jgi:heme/copper-type cytochrome/quinol oxidase subunit 3